MTPSRATAALLTAFLLGGAGQVAGAERGCNLTFSNGVRLTGIPVAKTNSAQGRGLAGRADVGPGMLFSWPSAEPRVFWMRDTHVPLTVGFFDADGKLFRVEDMEPRSDTYHFSMMPAKAALELPRGGFERAGLRIGERLLTVDC